MVRGVFAFWGGLDDSGFSVLETKNMADDIKDRPNNFPLPPVTVVVMLVIAFLLKNYAPMLALSFTSLIGLKILGWALVVMALAIDIWAARVFAAAKTNLMPTKPAENLVDHGPFKYSRNPIYVGNIMILIGVGMIAGIGLLYIFAILAVFILQEFQIKPEEAHLRARFGEAWDDYKSRVRRWI